MKKLCPVVALITAQMGLQELGCYSMLKRAILYRPFHETMWTYSRSWKKSL